MSSSTPPPAASSSGDPVPGSDAATSPGAQAILTVATALFSAKGFDGVSLNEIASRAGISKANIFHHFGTKQGLYLAVLKSACAHSVQALDTAAGATDGDPVARLQGFFGQHLAGLLAHPETSRLIQRELLEGGSEGGRRLAEEVFADEFARLVDLVGEGQRQGLLRTDFEAALLAFLLVGSNVMFFESRDVLRHLPQAGFANDPAGYSEAAFELMLHGAAKR